MLVLALGEGSKEGGTRARESSESEVLLPGLAEAVEGQEGDGILQVHG